MTEDVNRLPWGCWYHRKRDELEPVGMFGHFERAIELDQTVHDQLSDIILADGTKVYYTTWMYMQGYVCVHLKTVGIIPSVGLTGFRPNIVPAMRSVLAAYPVTASLEWAISIQVEDRFTTQKFDFEQIARIAKHGRLPAIKPTDASWNGGM